MAKADVRPRTHTDADARIEAHNTFPFTLRSDSIPTLSYVAHNLACSFATLLGSIGALVLTASVFVPLGVVGSLRAAGKAVHAARATTAATQEGSKVVIITGASAGIGEAIAETLVHDFLREAFTSARSRSAARTTAEGDHKTAPTLTLILTGRNEDRLEDTARRLREMAAARTETEAVLKVECRALDQGDLRVNDLAKALVRDTLAEHGRIDLLIANAGISGHYAENAPGLTPHSSQPPTKWGLDAATQLTQTNVVGTLALVLSVWEAMRDQPVRAGKQGQIVVTGSSAAFFGPPSFAVYSASKSYLYHFVQDLRQISFAYNIAVSLVSPGFILTSQTRSMRGTGGWYPLSQMGSVDDMARAAVDGAVHENRGVTFWPLGHNLPLYGCRGLNPLCEELGRWVATRVNAVSNLIS
ncbi:hypothetical protein OC842_000855 [Tilletia horrida]|uniref:NAD(P)-binding protein n=1 Tax=Tilletia horrida TaxID=155126 RepID=A0AAN6JMQ6_9BASI|nr:hypothetical protein OC842_000855 [Tilletia horrida]